MSRVNTGLDEDERPSAPDRAIRKREAEVRIIRAWRSAATGRKGGTLTVRAKGVGNIRVAPYPGQKRTVERYIDAGEHESSLIESRKTSVRGPIRRKTCDPLIRAGESVQGNAEWRPGVRRQQGAGRVGSRGTDRIEDLSVEVNTSGPRVAGESAGQGKDK
jgi:hypothetical protein